MTIAPRAGVNPDAGIREFGDIPFADPVNSTSPVDPPAHAHAAWRYNHHERDAAFDSRNAVARMERRIREAAETHGITLGDG